jgi:hypothetical protein
MNENEFPKKWASKRLDKIQEESKERSIYGEKRLIILQYALTAAGLYTCIEIVRHFSIHNLEHSLHLVFHASYLFLFSLGLDFASHWVSTRMNEIVTLWGDNIMENDYFETEKMRRLYNKSNRYEDINKVLNLFSRIFLFGAIIMLFAFFVTYSS